MGIKKGNKNIEISAPGEQENNKNIAVSTVDNSAMHTPEKTAPIKVDKEGLPTKSPKSSKKKYKYALGRRWDFARNIKKGAGVRQSRRYENLNTLMNLTEKDELEDSEIPELVEPHFSVFAELFMEHEKMKLWNDFINRTEEDQESILHHIEAGQYGDNGLDVTDSQPPQVDRQDSNCSTSSVGSTDSWEDLGDDKRQSHPAFSAEECFTRIDQKLKSFLKRKHVPFGTLQYLEEDVISFFSDYPTSVLISQPGTSFERMMLHALCQYLDLASHSYDNDQGVRQMEVENNQTHFTPPDMTLTQFLEKKDGKANH